MLAGAAVQVTGTRRTERSPADDAASIASRRCSPAPTRSRPRTAASPLAFIEGVVAADRSHRDARHHPGGRRARRVGDRRGQRLPSSIRRPRLLGDVIDAQDDRVDPTQRAQLSRSDPAAAGRRRQRQRRGRIWAIATRAAQFSASARATPRSSSTGWRTATISAAACSRPSRRMRCRNSRSSRPATRRSSAAGRAAWSTSSPRAARTTSRDRRSSSCATTRLDASNVEDARSAGARAVQLGVHARGARDQGSVVVLRLARALQRDARRHLRAQHPGRAQGRRGLLARSPRRTAIRPFGKYNRRVGEQQRPARRDRATRAMSCRTSWPARTVAAEQQQQQHRATRARHVWRSRRSSEPRCSSSTRSAYRDQDFDQNQDLGGGRQLQHHLPRCGGSFRLRPADRQRAVARSALLHRARGREPACAAAARGEGRHRVHPDGGRRRERPGLVRRPRHDRAPVRANGRESFQIPQGVGFINPGDELTRLRNNGVSLFAQDDWRVHPQPDAEPRRALRLRFEVRRRQQRRAAAGDRLESRRADGRARELGRLLRSLSPRHRAGGARVRRLQRQDRRRAGLSAAGRRRALRQPGGQPRRAGATAWAIRSASTARSASPPNAVVTREQRAGADRADAGPVRRARSRRASWTGVGTSCRSTFRRRPAISARISARRSRIEIRVARPFETPYNSTFTVGVRAGAARRLVRRRHLRAPRGSATSSACGSTNLAFSRAPSARAVTTDGGPIQRTYGAVVRRRLRRVDPVGGQALQRPLPVPGELHLCARRRTTC